MSPLLALAPAKINLYLHVTGRRANGYHELDSLIAFAGIGDTLTATPSPSLSLNLSGPFAKKLPDGEDNLVFRAARHLAQETQAPATAAMTLEKHLPIASGIGGGSADAAACVRLLMKMWDVHLEEEALMDLALDLGADVPVCLLGKSAFLKGIGESLQLSPPLPPTWLVLVNPGVSLSTPAVFKALRGNFGAPPPSHDIPPGSPQELAAWLKERRNDLEKPALELAPEISGVLEALHCLPGSLLARMSGSGATCFALFAEKAEAEGATEALSKSHPNWWIKAAPLLDGTQGFDF